MKKNRLKRYLLFAGYDHYPHGSWNDFVGSFDELEKAKKGLLFVDSPYIPIDWYQLVDTKMETVWSWSIRIY